MKRLVASLIGVVLIALLIAAPVAADPPIRQYSGQATEFTITGICPFDVLHTPLVNNEYVTTFFDRAGNPVMVLIAGAWKIQLTNVSTGKTLILNMPGVAHIDLIGSTITATGPWFIYLPDGIAPTFSPRMFTIHGRLVGNFDPAYGFTTIDIARGRVIDMCAALAAP